MLIRRVPAGGDRIAEICFTDRTDGDFCTDRPTDELSERRSRILQGPWVTLSQVHGSRVVSIDSVNMGTDNRADAAVTRAHGIVLAVHTADCAAVCLVGDGEVSVAHAGWRGLLTGVVPAALEAMSTVPERVRALIGPCIRPGNYEFGAADLDAVTAVTGGAARSVTFRGALALDLGAAIVSLLESLRVGHIEDLGFDTADERWFSHRVRGERERQATAMRLVAA